MTLTMSSPIMFSGLPGDDWWVRQVINMSVDFVAVVWEQSVGWRGSISIIQWTSSTTVNEGAPYLVIDNAPNSEQTMIRATPMDGNHLLVVYNDNISKEVRGIILNRVGLSLTLSAGPTTVVASYNTNGGTYLSPVAFTNILAAVVYRDINDNDWRKAKLLTLTNTSISVGVAQNLAEGGQEYNHYDIIAVSSVDAILAYYNVSGLTFTDRIGRLTVSGTSLSIAAQTVDTDFNQMELDYDPVSGNISLLVPQHILDVRSYAAIPLTLLDQITNTNVNDLVDTAYLAANLAVMTTAGNDAYEYQIADDGTITELSIFSSFDPLGFSSYVGSFGNSGLFGLICYKTFTPDSRMVIVKSDFTPPPISTDWELAQSPEGIPGRDTT